MDKNRNNKMHEIYVYHWPDGVISFVWSATVFSLTGIRQIGLWML